jgi:DNA polymerase, archaea type
MTQDKLLFGKNEKKGIVSIEPNDEFTEVFIEANGFIQREFINNKYWMLSPRPHGRGWVRLQGNLHYKWGKQFSSRQDYLQHRQLLKKEDIYSIFDAKEAAMVKDGITYFKDLSLSDVSVLSFDLETTGLDPNDPEAKVLLISTTARYSVNSKPVIAKRLFTFDHFKTQGEMLAAFCDYVRAVNPSIIIGHNILSFDLPYIKTIAEKEEVRLLLGRDGSAIQFDKYESQFRKESNQFIHYNRCKIYGREVVDTLFLSIKHDVASRKYTSYKLKTIIAQEGLEKKDRVFYDASQIRHNYKDKVEWEKIKAYCEDDADDALALFDLMAPPFFYMTQSIPKSFQAIIESASGSQLNSFMARSYLQEGHSLPKSTTQEKFEGAISEGNPGIYKNVHKVDVSSLYPSIILQYEVYDKEKDPRGNFLNMVKSFTKTRLFYKSKLKETGDKKFDALQGAFKILINSAYGFMGAPGLAFNSPSNAAFITQKGREILTEALQWAEKKGFTIVNCDTDSIAYAKKTEHGWWDFSQEEREDLIKDLNGLYPEKISFEDDGYYKTVVVLKAKNYVLWDGKKIKTKGSALKATTKEPALRDLIDDIIDSMIKTDEVNLSGIYGKYVNEALNVKDIKRWASRKSITDAILNPERTNEKKVADALNGQEFQAGDRRYFYFKPDGTLSVVENFDGNYDQYKLIEKIWKTFQIFSTVLDTGSLPKYHLKTKRHLLGELK